jgi:hypothetical protein
MSQLEDEIRESLRAEASRLRAVRPLSLEPAAAWDEPGAVRAPRGWRSRSWQAPAVAAAVIVLVAAALAGVRALTAGGGTVTPAPSPAASSSAPGNAAPRYYVELTTVGEPEKPGTWSIVAGDERTGKTVGTYSLHAGSVMTSMSASGAADDRTFVVSAYVGKPFSGPASWYLVKLVPGAAAPLRVTRLPIRVTGQATEVISSALSADGTELAVLSGAGKSVTLAVYSVATGQLRHSWSAPFSQPVIRGMPVTDLSWVGDDTVGFALTRTPDVREEVRTLNVNSGGTALLTGSRVVWSQYVPGAVSGKSAAGTPQTCDTPFLTGDGQAVVCGTSSYSASDKRFSVSYLAYPLATPARPRVIGTVATPAGTTGLAGPVSVQWTNSTGTEVIGTWNPKKHYTEDGSTVIATQNDFAYIGGGEIRQFSWVPGLDRAAW